MFEMSERQIADYREQLQGYASEKVSEPIVAAAVLRRGGAAGKMAVSHAGLGALVYGAAALRAKKQAGSLPDKTFFVATPTTLHAFKARIKGRGWKIGDEVAAWDRASLRASTEQRMGLTMLTLESPGDGTQVTMAPVGIKDDPVSLELMRVLQENETEA